MPKKKKKQESWKEKQRKRLLKLQRAQEVYQIQRERETERKPRKWPKGKIIVAFSTIILIFGIYGYWQYYNSQLPPTIGGASNNSPTSEFAPTFSLKDINGTQFSLNQHAGKVILIHFMAVGCSGQIREINKHQLLQLGSLCNTYCGKKPAVIVTVAVATCPNSQLTNLRSNYNIKWFLGNDYDDQTLDIVNAYAGYSINDGTVILVGKNLRVAQVYRDELSLDTVKAKIDELLEA
ncbi:MAG: peroxiredoxin family protein [Candidatus Bathyarchaeales archaeon]